MINCLILDLNVIERGLLKSDRLFDGKCDVQRTSGCRRRKMKLRSKNRSKIIWQCIRDIQ